MDDTTLKFIEETENAWLNDNDKFGNLATITGGRLTYEHLDNGKVTFVLLMNQGRTIKVTFEEIIEKD